MTRYVVDAAAAIHLAGPGAGPVSGIELLAPTLLRSQMLATLHRAVGTGEMSRGDGLARLDAVRGLRIRLLGDRVLQKVAWEIADELGEEETFDAEYIALTRLQADALVTLDEGLARAARRFVAVARLEEITSGVASPSGPSSPQRLG